MSRVTPIRANTSVTCVLKGRFLHLLTKTKLIFFFFQNSFSVYNRFKHHYAFHLNRTINQCDQCKKCFEKPETLKTHIKRHNGTLPRNFPCGYCEKRFASRWAQENHERSHTKEVHIT